MIETCVDVAGLLSNRSKSIYNRPFVALPQPFQIILIAALYPLTKK